MKDFCGRGEVVEADLGVFEEFVVAEPVGDSRDNHAGEQWGQLDLAAGWFRPAARKLRRKFRRML